MKIFKIIILSFILTDFTFGQESWTLSNTGIEQGFNVTDFTVTQSNTIFATGTKIILTPTYISTPAIYKSLDNGDSWAKVTTTGLINHNYLYNGICSTGSTFLLSASNNSQDYAVYKSIDNGNSWNLSNTGIEQGFNVTDFTVTQSNTIFATGTKIILTPTYISTPAIYKSLDNGDSWAKVTTTGLINHNYLYNGICTIGNTFLLSASNSSQDYAVYKSLSILTTIELSYFTDLKIFPIPATDFINIEFGSERNFKNGVAEIITVNGVLVATFNFPIYKIDISKLSPGIYLLFIKTDKYNFDHKFIKQ